MTMSQMVFETAGRLSLYAGAAVVAYCLGVALRHLHRRLAGWSADQHDNDNSPYSDGGGSGRGYSYEDDGTTPVTAHTTADPIEETRPDAEWWATVVKLLLSSILVTTWAVVYLALVFTTVATPPEFLAFTVFVFTIVGAMWGLSPGTLFELRGRE